MSRSLPPSFTNALRGQRAGDSSVEQHPIGRRVNEISRWMRDLAEGNGITEGLEVQAKKMTAVEDVSEIKERVDQKIEEDEWADDVPHIEAVEDYTDDFPFAPNRQRVNHNNTGLWHVRLSNGDELFHSASPLNLDSNDVINLLRVLAGTEEAIDTFGTIQDGVETGIDLEPGVYSLRMSARAMALGEDVDLSETPVVHPEAEDFFRSVEQFFENPDPYTRLGQPGLKTWLLYGTYGTGKSTMVECLARQMKEETAVVFASGSTKMRAIANVAADQNAPTIVIVSEAETILNDSDGEAPAQDANAAGASSEMLNFLDGVDQPRNTSGTALILTTNRPKRISDRILKRTGRINKHVHVGALEGEYAVECARIYLPDDAEVSDETIEDVAGGRVGDDIKSMVEGAIRIAVEREMPVNDEIFRQAGEEMKESMQQIEEFDGMHDESHEFSESSAGF